MLFFLPLTFSCTHLRTVRTGSYAPGFYFASETMKEACDKNYGNSSTILKSRNEERADFTFHDIILLILMRKIFWRIYIIVTLMSEEKKPRHIAIKNTRDLHTRSIYIWRLRIEQLKWARCLFLSH